MLPHRYALKGGDLFPVFAFLMDVFSECQNILNTLYENIKMVTLIALNETFVEVKDGEKRSSEVKGPILKLRLNRISSASGL